ncbi:MAG: hypothetical protein ABI679_04230 [Gemmatimonadota bacterium]
MIRMVIVGLVVFLLALGGGSGVAYMRRPKAAALVTDTTSVKPGVHPDTTRPSVTLDTAITLPPHSVEPHDTLSAPAITPIASPTVAVPRPPAVDTAAAAQTPLDQEQAFAQMARILAKMKPVEAQLILARLSDDQVERLIRQLSVRQAAAMLALLPADRAAALSRSMLVHFKATTR